MSTEFTRAELLSIIDHTLLIPETTFTQIEQFIIEAHDMGVRRVCISPNLLPISPRTDDLALALSNLEIVTVVGFPSGTHGTSIKAAEAELAIKSGATEIDAVANIGLIKEGNFRALETELRALRDVTNGYPLKIILETACLTHDEIIASCHVARDVGCDFVKTSTGFHPAGGATVEAVSVMANTVGPDIGVKASGGIRTASQARAMRAAGATRLGVSATQRILDQWDADESEPVAAGDNQVAY